jgi:hypothetical protein
MVLSFVKRLVVVALVDDDLVARLAVLLADHHCIAGLTLLDDGRSALVALTNGHAGSYGSDAHTYAGLIGLGDVGTENDTCGHRRDINQILHRFIPH